MKKVKKLISIILILILTIVPFLSILNVKAEDNSEVVIETVDGINLITNTSTITVSNLPNNDELFSAYKILDAFYSSVTNEITYEFTTDFSNFLAQSDKYKELKVKDYTAMTSESVKNDYINGYSDLAKLSGDYATYIRNNSVSGLDMITKTSTAYLDNVSVGAYLILPRSNKYVYGVMVGNVEIYAENNMWKVRGASIVAKYDDLMLDTYITDKFATTIEEYLSIVNSFVVNKSFVIGQEYTNYVATDIDYPANAINDLYKIEITFDDGITFSGFDTLMIANGEHLELATINESNQIVFRGSEAGYILFDGTTLIVEVDLNVWSPSSLGLLFRTRLNENATIGNLGNMMTTRLYYARDPFDMNSTTYVESVNTSYTYGLKVNNYGDEDKTSKLSGSVFEVYSDSDLSNKIGELSINNGTGTYLGLAEGTYYVKQNRVSSGYNLLDEVLEVNVGNSSDYIELDVINSRVWFLPSTGGMGTVIYTIVGLAIIGIASIFLVKYRKNSVNM